MTRQGRACAAAAAQYLMNRHAKAVAGDDGEQGRGQALRRRICVCRQRRRLGCWGVTKAAGKPEDEGRPVTVCLNDGSESLGLEVEAGEACALAQGSRRLRGSPAGVCGGRPEQDSDSPGVPIPV